MPKVLFSENQFDIQYILRNKIIAIALVNTYATRYSFINEKFAKKVCLVLEPKLQCLIKPKQ